MPYGGDQSKMSALIESSALEVRTDVPYNFRRHCAEENLFVHIFMNFVKFGRSIVLSK